MPVSAMIYVPKAQEVFAADGSAQAAEEQAPWFDYFARAFNQLFWWAQAAREHRAEVDLQAIFSEIDAMPMRQYEMQH